MDNSDESKPLRLTDVLVRSVLAIAGVVVPLVALLAFLLAGPDWALGVFAGGLLSAGGGIVIVHVIGRLLDPSQKPLSKVAFTVLLLVKLGVAFAVLWWLIATVKVSIVALALGLGIGLFAVVLGVNRGSTSDRGLAALAWEEERIRQEMEDT